MTVERREVQHPDLSWSYEAEYDQGLLTFGTPAPGTGIGGVVVALSHGRFDMTINLDVNERLMDIEIFGVSARLPSTWHAAASPAPAIWSYDEDADEGTLTLVPGGTSVRSVGVAVLEEGVDDVQVHLDEERRIVRVVFLGARGLLPVSW